MKTIKCQESDCDLIAQNAQVSRKQTMNILDEETGAIEFVWEIYPRKFFCGLHFAPGKVTLHEGSTYQTPSSAITPEDLETYGTE